MSVTQSAIKGSQLVNGYAVWVHNDEPMIEDFILATRLGYSEERNIRNLIRRMLERGQLQQNQVCVTATQTSSAGGRPGIRYFLNEKACLKVVTKAATAEADRITDEIIDVFVAVRQMRGVPSVGNHCEQKALSLLKVLIEGAQILGIDDSLAKTVAVEQVQKVAGFSFKPLLEDSGTHEMPLLPSELGRQLGVSGKAMNKMLAEAGLQVMGSSRRWQVTERGKRFCIWSPSKPFVDDRCSHRILWFESVLKELGNIPAQMALLLQEEL